MGLATKETASPANALNNGTDFLKTGVNHSDSIGHNTAQNIYENGDYLENNIDWHASESPWKANHILNLLNRNSVSFNTVTEVGCGAGRILQLLNKAMPEKSFTGFDISPQAADLWPRESSSSGNLRYRLEDFLNVEDCFDLLLLIDVFEHIPDYMGFLQQLSNRAQQFVFHIPLDMNSLMTVKGEHLQLRERIGHIHYFSKATALATLQDCGYKIVDWFYTKSYTLPEHERSINPLRKLLFRVNPDLTATLLGGLSMMVLAEPEHTASSQ